MSHEIHEIHDQHCRCPRCASIHLGSFLPNQIATAESEHGFQLTRIACLSQIVAFGIPALIFFIAFLTQ